VKRLHLAACRRSQPTPRQATAPLIEKGREHSLFWSISAPTLVMILSALVIGRLRRVPLTAADKLHNLVAIAVLDERLRPLRPRQNFQVALDRHPPAVECKLAQQVRHASACLGAAGYAVYRYCDCSLQDSSRCGNLRLGAQLKM